MENSKLTEALRQLPSKELPRFLDFVQSPFFNKNEKVIRLAEEVIRYAPDFRHKALEKRKVYHLVFGKSEVYNDLKFNNLSSKLLKLFYQFLSESSFQNDVDQKLRLQLEQLNELELDHHSDLLLKRHQREKSKSENNDLNEFLEGYFLEENLHNLWSQRQVRKASPHLQSANDKLDTWYVVQKLRKACQMENGNILVQAGYECHFMGDISTWLEKKYPHISNEPLVKIYASTLSMLESHPFSAEEQDARFLICKKELQAHASRLETGELYTLSHYLLNFCIKKINTGKNQYYREIFELYQLLLEGETIFRNGHISQWTFRNVITAGIRLEEFNWTEKFIENYKNYLPENERHTAVAYNLALLYLAKKNYTDTLHSLLEVEFSDPFYYVSSRIIQAQCYFELEEEQAFSALLTSTQKYLRRSKLSDYHKKSNGNFLKMLKKLFQVKNNKRYMKASDFNRKYLNLKSELSMLEPVVNKAWLKVKMEEQK